MAAPGDILGRRICVVGTSGSGKSYVAQAIAQRLAIPYVCNDAIIWRPEWVPTPDEQRAVEMEAATRGDAWTFDGNFGRPEDDIVFERCDTIVWLDLPRWQVHSQTLWRTLRGLVTKEPHWENGNVERWRIFLSSDNIVWWSIKTFASRRRDYTTLCADPDYADRHRIRFRSRREVDAWLAALC